MEKLEEDIADSVRPKNKFESQGESIQDSCKTSNDVQCRDVGSQKAQEKKLDVAEMMMLRWMSGVTKLDRIRNERIRGTTQVGEISKKMQESKLKWYGHVLRREDEYVGKRVVGWRCRGKEGEEDQSGGGWIASGTTCRKENCQGRTRKTGLDGGVSQDTSTPHKSGKR